MNLALAVIVLHFTKHYTEAKAKAPAGSRPGRHSLVVRELFNYAPPQTMTLNYALGSFSCMQLPSAYSDSTSVILLVRFSCFCDAQGVPQTL